MNNRRGLSKRYPFITFILLKHIDFLGYLYGGGSSPKEQAEKAVAFIRDYLGRVDTRYARMSGLLYFILSHGLIHKSEPERIQIKKVMVRRTLIIVIPS